VLDRVSPDELGALPEPVRALIDRIAEAAGFIKNASASRQKCLASRSQIRPVMSINAKVVSLLAPFVQCRGSRSPTGETILTNHPCLTPRTRAISNATMPRRRSTPAKPKPPEERKPRTSYCIPRVHPGGLGGRPRKLTPALRRAFLVELAECGVFAEAEWRVGISDGAVLDLRHADPEFQTQVNAALKQFADKMEGEALRRAYEGNVEPLVSAGKIVTTVTRYYNRLLETVLRARRPAEYREKHEIIHDVSDRMWVRLEAARQRMLALESGRLIDDEAVGESMERSPKER
jgi:hypothetical protein